jgi:3-dehydroquinate dehydratase-2
MSPIIYLLNGPNLNLLGQREPQIYGHDTLAEVEARCQKLAAGLQLGLECHQSNHEGELIDLIQQARARASALIINPGGFTHTSVAIRDALQTCAFPIFEVHISNVHQRESFRHHSYVSGVATGVLAGFGTQGYELALQRVARLISEKS